jgi:hypothetical protein
MTGFVFSSTSMGHYRKEIGKGKSASLLITHQYFGICIFAFVIFFHLPLSREEKRGPFFFFAFEKSKLVCSGVEPRGALFFISFPALLRRVRICKEFVFSKNFAFLRKKLRAML